MRASEKEAVRSPLLFAFSIESASVFETSAILLLSFSLATIQIIQEWAIAMTTLLKPSTLIPKGLQVQQINNLTLFKFTDELGDRMQVLLDKKKADTLTAEETLELEAIGELDEIFSYINAVMVARADDHP